MTSILPVRVEDLTYFVSRSRLSFLRSLGRDQFDPKLANYVSPELLTVKSDEIFCEKAARCSPVLFDDYQRTL